MLSTIIWVTCAIWAKWASLAHSTHLASFSSFDRDPTIGSSLSLHMLSTKIQYESKSFESLGPIGPFGPNGPHWPIRPILPRFHRFIEIRPSDRVDLFTCY